MKVLTSDRQRELCQKIISIQKNLSQLSLCASKAQYEHSCSIEEAKYWQAASDDLMDLLFELDCGDELMWKTYGHALTDCFKGDEKDEPSFGG